MHYWLNEHDINTDTQFNHASSASNDFEAGPIEVSNPDIEEIYPRLGFEEDHMARSLSIVDNLDEVLLTHQGILFPLQMAPKKAMRRKVNGLENTDSPIFKRPEEHLYDDWDEY